MTAAISLAVAILFLAAAWGAAPLGDASHTEHPTVYEESVDRAGAFGVRANLASQGNLTFSLDGYGPVTASQLSVGFALFDSDKQLRFMDAFAVLWSPDRLIVSPPDIEDSTQEHPEWWIGRTVGDDADLADVELTFETFAPSDGDDTPRGSVGAASSNGRIFAVGLTLIDADPGTHYAILWIGGVSSSTFSVATAQDVDVATVAGTGYAAGDPEFLEGDPNVQVQQHNLGAKAIREAPFEATIEHGLYGFFDNANFKVACQSTVGECLWLGSETTRISWEGPDGAGEDGRAPYTFVGEPAGDYAFIIDRKVDLYGPSVGEPVAGTHVFLGEDSAILTVADAALP